MRPSVHALPALLIALSIGAVACATEQTPTDPNHPSLVRPQQAEHDEYPDSTAEPAPNAYDVSQFAYGTFEDANASWLAKAIVDYAFITDANYALNAYVKRNVDGSTLNSGPATKAKPDKSLWVSHEDQDSVKLSTLNHTCGLTGSSTLHVQAGAHFVVAGVDVLQYSYDQTTKAADVVLPDCPNPESRPLLSYGDMSGDELHLTVPEGSGANVSMVSASKKGSDGSTDIATYAWSVAGSSVSSSASTSYYFPAGEALALTVTDQDNHSDTASGLVDLSYFSPCDDPFTDEVETCEQNPGGGGSVSVDGSSDEPGDWTVPVVIGTYVCYYTDWYENGVYTGETDLDYCDVE